MKEISHTGSNQNDINNMANPEKKVHATSKKKHQIIYFEWTIRLIWQFFRHQIRWVVKKIIRNLLAAFKKKDECNKLLQSEWIKYKSLKNIKNL